MALPLPMPAPAVREESPLSERFWGLRWTEHFPLEISPRLSVEVSPYEDVMTFMGKHYSAIFGLEPQSTAFPVTEDHRAREAYYRAAGDFFAVKSGEQMVGVFICNAVDWSGYYLRSLALLPEYQGKKIYQTFLGHLLDTLRRHGVDRVEVDISPSNLPSTIVHAKMGFHPSGTVLSTRWGVLARYTRFLNPRHESVFYQQFCTGRRDKRRT